MRRSLWWTLIAAAAIFLVAIFLDLPGTNQFLGRGVQINQGIDLAGGARLLLCSDKKNPSDADMNTARDVIAARANGGFGVTEPQVSRVNGNCISVEMPGLKNQSQLMNSLGKTGFLALTDSGTTNLGVGQQVTLTCKDKDCGLANPKIAPSNPSASPKPILQVVVPGKYVSQGSAQVGFDSAGQPDVTYTLHGRGSTDWCNFTTNNVNKYSAIVLDNQVVSDPVIQQAICGGQTQITGLTGTSEANTIATYLNYGALPISFHVDSSQQVSASLGPEYVREAKLAGIIGLVIVALFMLLYYRLPGLLADLALVMYAVVVFALFKIIGVTMTLAGIAGFILSIGMAVDANVLIFERMREELRSGKTLGAAVEAGFSRAFPAIRDSNASTIITTIILFWFGHNFAATTITGFATTLFIGVVISFITAVYVSRTFLRLLVASGAARNPTLYGVESMGGAQSA